MKRLTVLLLFTLIAAARPGVAQDSDLAKKFIGAWKLVTIEGTQAGLPADYWDHPTGMIIYLPNGQMAVQIANKINRKSLGRNRAQWFAASPADKAAAFDSYTAYYGTYTIDAKSGTVTHHLQDSLTPGRKGDDNVRWYEFHGNDRIVLIPVEDGKGGRVERESAAYKLTWERIK